MHRLRCLCLLSLLVLAACGGGGGGHTNTGNGSSGGGTGSGLPSAPTALTATGERERIRLEWSASSGATSYNIYWSETPGVTAANGNRIVTQFANGIIDNLRHDRVYYVVVTAENAQGESAASAEASAQPEPFVPASLHGVKVTAGNGEASVKWDLKASADNYTVTVSTSPDGGGDEYVVDAPPMVVTGLTNDTVYYVGVAGNNDVGQGSATFWDVIPFAPPPGWSQQILLNDSTCPDVPQPCGTSAGATVVGLDINQEGEAAVAWYETAPLNSMWRALMAYTVDGEWSDPILVEEKSGADGNLAVAPNGDIHFVNTTGEVYWDGMCRWPDLSRTLVWRRLSGGEWSSPEEIQNPDVAHSIGSARLDVDESGNLTVIWVEFALARSCGDFGDVSTKLWARRLDAATGTWGDAVEIGSSPQWIYFPDIVAGAPGQAFVAWLQDTEVFDRNQDDGGPEHTVAFATHFDGSSWQPPQAVGRNDLVNHDDTREIRLDADSNGYATVVWGHALATNWSSTDSQQVGAARFDPALGQWSAPELVAETSTASYFNIDGSLGPGGAVNTAWYGRGVFPPVRFSSFDPIASLWEVDDGVVPFHQGLETDVSLETDAAGLSFLVWGSTGDPAGIFVNQLDPATAAWGNAERIGPRIESHPRPHFKMHKSGHAILVNRASPGRLYATIYTPD